MSKMCAARFAHIFGKSTCGVKWDWRRLDEHTKTWQGRAMPLEGTSSHAGICMLPQPDCHISCERHATLDCACLI